MTVPVGPTVNPLDLAAACFVALAEEFYDEAGLPRPFKMRDKLDTQDDPFDELIRDRLNQRLPSGVKVIESEKKLVSPDLVVARPEEASLLINGGVELDERRLIAIEVKKVNADTNGQAARASGMDYNSTPPCSRVKIYSKYNTLLTVPAFYLFAIHASQGEARILQGLALVSGMVLNQDTELYNSRTGIRQKSIDLGTFGDGADRERPMLVFANPLGWGWLKTQPTLIHQRADLADEQDDLHRVRQIVRTAKDGTKHEFWAYRRTSSAEEDIAIDPFPTPRNRSRQTAPRGRFKVDL
ncbi:hypothetical protein [Nocardia farcinica]|uniref:hypothetical protein n=1 Tax=Nocardia farcinica TaxID=37329 RepID=UPI00245495B6|nr:hypothetical protein [Nocardia farcinica]